MKKINIKIDGPVHDHLPRMQSAMIIVRWFVLVMVCSVQAVRGQRDESNSETVVGGDAGNQGAQSSLVQVIVDSYQESPPEQPVDVLRAVQVLRNIGQVELAKQYLGQLAAAKLDDRQWRQLYTELGATYFLELSLDKRLADAAEPLVSAVFAAVRRQLDSPQFLTKVLRRLESNDVDVYRTALNELRDTGAWGVAGVLNRLRKEELSAAVRAQLIAALQEMVARNAEPLITAVRSTDAPLHSAAMHVLAVTPLDASDSLRIMASTLNAMAVHDSLAMQVQQRQWGGPTRWARLHRLVLTDIQHRLSTAEQAGTTPHGKEIDVDLLVDDAVIWFWDAQEQIFTPQVLRHDLAEAVIASQLAEDLLRIDVNEERHHEVYLQCVLSALQLAAGPNGTIPADDHWTFAISAPTSRVLRVLDEALRMRWPAMAIGACRVLEVQGHREALAGSSPLIRAIRDPSSAVRFAAVKACIRLDPNPSMAGAFDLWREAVRTVATQGQREVLIIDPNRLRGFRLAGLARQSGWQATSVGEPREGIRRLYASPDIDLILIHEELRTPPWTEVVQQMRFEPWSSEVPIIMLYDVDQRPGVETIPVSAGSFPRPFDDDSWRALLRSALPLESSASAGIVRAARATQIMPWVRRSRDRWQSILSPE